MTRGAGGDAIGSHLHALKERFAQTDGGVMVPYEVAEVRRFWNWNRI